MSSFIGNIIYEIKVASERHTRQLDILDKVFVQGLFKDLYCTQFSVVVMIDKQGYMKVRSRL